MSTIVVLAPAVRSAFDFGHAGDPNPAFTVLAGTPRPYTVSLPSTDWTDVAQVGTLQLACPIERSLDGGTTWEGYSGFDLVTNAIGKNSVISQASFSVSWDGQAMLLRGNVQSIPAFSWGISLT